MASIPRSAARARALTVALVVATIIAIITVAGDPAWRPVHYVAKPLATIAILLLAITTDPPRSKRYRAEIVAGLAASLVGDIVLMLPGDHFVAGLIAFLVAHVCYIGAFLAESRFLARRVTLVGYLAVAVALLVTLYRGLPATLLVPVIVYMGVITVMAAQSASWMLSSPSSSSRYAAIGAAWFLVSDATLAIDRFRLDVPYRDLIVLGTYYVAQWYLARSVARNEPFSTVAAP
jgi:uncharacterized membrane protein YhhN